MSVAQHRRCKYPRYYCRNEAWLVKTPALTMFVSYPWCRQHMLKQHIDRRIREALRLDRI